MNDFEQEISLKDMLLYLIKSKKYIILSFIVGATLFSFFAFASIYKNTKIDQKILQEEKEEYNREKSLFEKEIEDLIYIVEEDNKDSDNSLILSYNPYKTEEINLDIFLDAKQVHIIDDKGSVTNLKMNELIKKYMNEAVSFDMYTKLEKNFDINRKYLEEVISTVADYGSSSFTVRMISDNREKAEYILYFIYENLKTVSDEELKQYNLTNSKLRIYPKNSDDIRNIQENFYKKKEDNLKKLKLKENSYENLDNKYLHHHMSKKDILKFVIKKLIIGGILGTLFSLIVLVALYLLNDKIKTEQDLQKIFGYFYLGKVKKRDDYDVISVLISNKLKEAKNILLTGSIAEIKLEKVAKELQERTDKYKFYGVSQLYKKADILKKQDEYDAVILVEEVNKSDLNLIKRQIQVLEKNVFAYIILEK